MFKYTQQSDVNYRVFLKPNVLYNQASLTGDNGVFISEFVDYIKLHYNYAFKSTKKANIDVTYNVVAEMEGYVGEKEAYKSIWKKQFVLLPKKRLHQNSNAVYLQEGIPLKLPVFNSFAANVIQTSKVDSMVKMAVVMNIETLAESGKSKVVEHTSPRVVIPLRTDFFEITKSQIGERPGVVQKFSKIRLPLNKAKVIGFALLSGILFIALAYLLFFTSAKVIEPLIRKLNHIFRSHGDRLVAVTTELVFDSKKQLEVKSIEDLVRVADEIGTTIMYNYNFQPKRITKFFVIGNDYIYVYDLSKDTNEVFISQAKKAGAQII